MTYQIELTKTVYLTKTLNIQASSKNEARKKAIKQAVSIRFQKASSYIDIDSIRKQG